MAAFKVEGGQTFLFIGDSITDCGRRDEHQPYGDGYVSQAVGLVTARYPDRDIRFINEGIGGNTVLDLQGRWAADALRHKPDWLSVKIGINDLHCALGGDARLTVPEYEKAYRDILTRVKQHCDPKLLLIDPFYISTDAPATSAVMKLLPDYIKVVHALAEEFGALQVTTHDLFQEQLKYRPTTAFCPEPVHPNETGHMVIAHAVLKALGW
jgi:lysophospholipase L1-like esterase